MEAVALVASTCCTVDVDVDVDINVPLFLNDADDLESLLYWWFLDKIIVHWSLFIFHFTCNDGNSMEHGSTVHGEMCEIHPGSRKGLVGWLLLLVGWWWLASKKHEEIVLVVVPTL